MPDISMCQHKDCPKSQQCWRFTATPKLHQSYMDFRQICSQENDYKWFWQQPNAMQKVQSKVERMSESSDKQHD